MTSLSTRWQIDGNISVRFRPFREDEGATSDSSFNRTLTMKQVAYPLPSFCEKRVLILGCGNILLGDDGFGPAVVRFIEQHYKIPEDVGVIDVGTGVRELLFTIALNIERTRRIVIVDAVDQGKSAGDIFEISVMDLPAEKCDDFSLHEAPTLNLAMEIGDKGVDIRVLVCQVEKIPESVEPGLTAPLATAVPRMAELLATRFFD